MQWKRDAHSFRVNAFRSRFANYISLEATGAAIDNDGEALPEFAYRAVRARFHGADAGGSMRLLDGPSTLDLELRADVVRASNADTGEPLPRIAPLIRTGVDEFAYIVVRTSRDGGDIAVHRTGAFFPELSSTMQGRTDTLHKVKGGGWAHLNQQEHVEEIWKQTQMELSAEVDRLVYEQIRARRLASPGDDILSMLIEARDAEGHGLDDDELRDELVTLLTQEGFKQTASIQDKLHKKSYLDPKVDLTMPGQALLLDDKAVRHRVLHDDKIEMYGCGRQDVIDNRIDDRVLRTLIYLRLYRFDPTVTALECGHSFFTTSGNVSEHSSGDAVDIAAAELGEPLSSAVKAELLGYFVPAAEQMRNDTGLPISSPRR